MKKRICIMVTAAIFFITGAALAFTREEAESRIQIAQQLLIKVDSASRLRPYMPTDIYNSAMSELLEAQSLVTQQNYSIAYYKATMACVKLKTLPILAEAKEVREQIVALQPAPKENRTVEEPEKNEKALMLGSETRVKELIAELMMQKKPEPEPEKPEKTTVPERVERKKTIVQQPLKEEARIGKSLSSLIIKASLERKGDVYRRYVPDSVLFTISKQSLTCSLTPGGKRILDSIIEMVKYSGSTSITIASYSSQNDGPGFPFLKAGAVSDYLLGAGIPAARIRVYGFGGAESMGTPLGKNRVDRVEVIISGLNVE